MMSAPYLFIGLPAVMAPLLYVLRRWRRVQVAAAGAVPLLLTALALILPLDQPIGLLGGLTISSSTTVLGRAFVVEVVDRLALAFILSQAAVLFWATWLARPSRYFLPAGMAALGLLSAALFVRPFLFAALFIELAAALAVFVLGDESRPVTRGALRFLVFMTLGMPFILLTGWLIEGSAASPADTSFIYNATLLLAAGFAVLLAVIPFHSWLPVVADSAPPLASAFVFTVMQFAILFLLLTFMDAFAWLQQNAIVLRGLTVAGGGMALVGAIFAFGQRNFGRSVGYAMMTDIGASLLAVGLGTPAGVQAALGTLAVRGLALPLWAVGLQTLRRAAGGDDFDSLRGLAWSYPFASAAVILGLLSLVGFPPTVGFTARWALLGLLAQIHPTAAIFLLVSMISVGFVCARGLTALLTPPEDGAEWVAPWLERPVPTVVYGVGLVLVLVLGAFPQAVLPAVAQTAALFARIGQ